MLVFYAFTDSQLINMCRIKASFYPHEKSVLIILKLPRMSSELINICSDYFDEIMFIEDPYVKYYQSVLVSELDLIMRKKKCLSTLFLKLNLYLDESVDRLFLAGFWRLGEYIAYYLSINNPTLSIAFVEEGIGSYFQSKRNLCFFEYREKKIPKKYFVFLKYQLEGLVILNQYHHRMLNYLMDYVDFLYVNNPSACRYNDGFRIISITEFDKINNTIQKISEKYLSSIDISEYIERKVIYLVQGNLLGDNTCEIVLNSLVNTFGGDNIIVKEHPEIKSNESLIKNIQKLGEQNIYIDNRNISFELLCSHICLNDKIIITINSSGAYLPKFLEGCEPYVVLLYNLYSDSYAVEISDWLSLILSSSYNNKQKISTPKSIVEFERDITNIL